MQKIRRLLRGQAVLLAALTLALGSFFLVAPSAQTLEYINFRVLGLLYCLMAVVNGFSSLNVFAAAARALCERTKTLRGLCAVLVGACFFSSMLITNDVALLTFVPFSLLVLKLCEQQRWAIYLLTLETVGANLGSSFTPVGNPQNLYLYDYYHFSAGHFFATTGPLTLASVLLLALLLLPLRGTVTPPSMEDTVALISRRKAGIYLGLFLLCLCTVFHLVPWPIAVAVVTGIVWVVDRSLLLRVDYSLLFTFICFFLFSGNLAALPPVQNFLHSFLEGRELLASALVSQVISNVPAAVMLSGFTTQGEALVLGTNIGGLGTLIASLASLISFRLYAAQPEARAGRYLTVFTLVNLLLLAPLLLFAVLWY